MSENEQGKRETIAEVVATMRQGTKLRGYWKSQDLNEILAYHADRIEAAWKREKAEAEADALTVGGVVEAARHTPGNAAAMREAILAIKDVNDRRPHDADGYEINDIINDVLSVPPRNCDRFADETDAQIAFLNEVWLISVTKETALERDRFENWTDEMRSSYAKWLLSTAEEREGEGDGR